MKTFLVTLILLSSIGCAVARDTSRLEWYPHRPTAFVTTPAGHVRDAGPFKSVQGGFVKDGEIDAAVDAGFAHFAKVFPNLKLGSHRIAINDDYAMFVPSVQEWASGEETTGVEMLQVCLWSRNEAPKPSNTPPPFISRPPGRYWGVDYVDWRWTSAPLLPALEHELLHAAIGDVAHNRPEWDVLEANPRP